MQQTGAQQAGSGAQHCGAQQAGLEPHKPALASPHITMVTKSVAMIKD